MRTSYAQETEGEFPYAFCPGACIYKCGGSGIPVDLRYSRKILKGLKGRIFRMLARMEWIPVFTRLAEAMAERAGMTK